MSDKEGKKFKARSQPLWVSLEVHHGAAKWVHSTCEVKEIVVRIETVSKTMYVDDMLIAAKNMYDVLALKALLSQKFDMKDLVLDRFGMSKAKPVSTPLANHFKLSIEQCPKTDREVENIAQVLYASAVGCLMYAMVCTLPDLAHAISQVCKYMSKLVVGYVDSDYAGDLDDRRSTIRYVFTLGGGPIRWKSTVQSIMTLSTTKAEYMVVAEAAKEALWRSGLSKELGVEQDWAVFRAMGEIDIGVVARECDGKVVGWLSQCFSAAVDLELVELFAARAGLEFAHYRGCPLVIMESDRQGMIHSLKEKSANFTDLGYKLVVCLRSFCFH
ncbi:UNVERIFIED_CONTAM: Retrovirus-related Pol polyprotein from transposon TNT 1-94 [Sesamum calycinum]|uniref:Retrovirus-related Pol polyprotein from transposon TNT 1-94 n=1 Tax=Sesamum calycinum TaxID=2727403 RepID=A0AAW2N420_9LAMI